MDRYKGLLHLVFIVFILPEILFSSLSVAFSQSVDEASHFGIDQPDLRYVSTISQLGKIQGNINGITWDALEPEAPVNGVHRYRWDLLDGRYKSLSSTGRDFVINIEPYNKWAMNMNDHFPIIDPGMSGNIRHGAMINIKPEHTQDWKNFISEFLKRYHTQYLQIGSEAENTWFSAEGYLQDVDEAREAAKEFDPSIKILLGGFNTADFLALGAQEQRDFLKNPVVEHKLSFIKESLDKGKKCFDILALHLNREYESIPPTLNWFEKEMMGAGYSKPIWANNMSSGPFLKDQFVLNQLKNGDLQATNDYIAEQSRLMVQKVVVALASGVEKVFVSSEVDWPQYPMPEWRHMGLLEDNGTPKPSFYNYQMLISKLSGYMRAEAVADHAYRFALNDGSLLLVVWSDSGNKTMDLSPYTNGPRKVKETTILTRMGETVQNLVVNFGSSDSVGITDTPVIVEQQ